MIQRSRPFEALLSISKTIVRNCINSKYKLESSAIYFEILFGTERNVLGER